MKVYVNGIGYTPPYAWEDRNLTAGRLQRIYSEWDLDKDLADRDFFKLFNILTDNDQEIDRTTENEVTIGSAIKWVWETPFNPEMPKILMINDKPINIPEEIGELSIGQNIHLKNEINGTKYKEEKIAIATAICLQPLYDNKPFDMKRAVALANKLEEMPAYLIYPIGFFLLNRVLKNGYRTPNRWNRILSSLTLKPKRMLQALRAWEDSLRTTI